MKMMKSPVIKKKDTPMLSRMFVSPSLSDPTFSPWLSSLGSIPKLEPIVYEISRSFKTSPSTTVFSFSRVRLHVVDREIFQVPM